MASPFAPDPEDDEQQEQPQVYGSAAVLLPEAWQDRGQPQTQAALQTAPPATMGTPPAPQQQYQKQYVSTASGAAMPSAVMLPTAPTPPPDGMPNYEAAFHKKETDSAPVKVAPKWWERLAGAGVGFGVGYKEGPTAGIRAGSAVTNRGQITADANRDSNVAADNLAIENFQKQQDMSRKGYEDQLANFRASLDAANAQRGQNNTDREFGRETANDTRGQGNADRDFQQRKEAAAAQLAQQAITNGFEGQRVGLEGRRVAIETQRAANEVANGGKPSARTTMTLNEFQNVVKQHDADYKNAAKDHAKALTDAKDADEIKQVNEDYQEKLGNLQNEWNVRYAQADPEGKFAPKGVPGAVTPQAPPAQAAPPPAAGQPQNAAPAAPPTPANPPSSPSGPPVAPPRSRARVTAGTVHIGSAVSDGKRTGVVKAINAQTGKPIVEWR